MDELVSDIRGVDLNPLKIIERPLGNIMHALKSTEESYETFGEAYFTFVNRDNIKGWKKHSKMKLNLIVPVGRVKFVLYDDRQGSSTKGQFRTVVLSRENYQRLTLSPDIWIAFKGMEEENMILNLASIAHDPTETSEKAISEFNFNW